MTLELCIYFNCTLAIHHMRKTK